MNLSNLAIFRRIIFIFGLLVFAPGFLAAQTLEKCAPDSSGNNYMFDISLPLPEPVKSVEVSANGKPLGDRANVDLHPIHDLDTDYVCDVLLVVGKSAGGSTASAQMETPAFQSFLKSVVNSAMATNRLRQMTRSEDAKQAGKDAHTVGPIPQLYRIEIMTLDGAAYETLASFGSDETKLDAAISTIQLSSGSQRVARGLSNIVADLKAEQGDRKFVVFVTTGQFDDSTGDFAEVTTAAKDAGIKICPVGFNKGNREAGLDALADVAQATQGLVLNTERENAQGEFPLAPEKIQDLLGYMTSGARGTFSLPDVTFPATVRFTVTTDYGKVYSVEGKLDGRASTATPSTSATTNAPTVPPSGANATNLTVAPAHGAAPVKTESTGALEWIEANPDLAGGIALGVLVIVGLAFFAISRRRSIPEASVTIPDEPQSPADEPILAWLVEGDNRHPLGEKPVRIGRKSDNDIVLHDDSVSQYHAEIVRRENGYVILDRSSSNKVLIAGRAVTREPLHDGDVIELGERRLRFELNS